RPQAGSRNAPERSQVTGHPGNVYRTDQTDAGTNETRKCGEKPAKPQYAPKRKIFLTGQLIGIATINRNLFLTLCSILSSTLAPCFSKKASPLDRKSTRLNSSHVKISYAVFCLKKKNR